MTAINIPDMCQIIKEHGLVPVSLDLDPDTMTPATYDGLEQLITDKTKCVLFAFLYGIRFDIEPFVQ
jgi:perosamine synthetase